MWAVFSDTFTRLSARFVQNSTPRRICSIAGDRLMVLRFRNADVLQSYHLNTFNNGRRIFSPLPKPPTQFPATGL